MSSFVQSALTGAFSGAFVAMAGWLVTHHLSLRRDEVARHEHASREFLEKQIQELYGPLLGLIGHGTIVYSVAIQNLPVCAGGVLDIERFSEAESEIWRYFIEHHFHPTNAAIRNLLRTRLHLLEGGVIPKSFEQFLRHDAQSDILFGLWKHKGVDSLTSNGEAWPADFESDVRATLNRLRDRHQRLVPQAGAKISL